MPRATITTSDAKIIPSSTLSSLTASARSIFDTKRASHPASCANKRASRMSAASRGKETARKSTLIFAANLMSSLSLAVRAGAVKPPP